MVRRGTAAMVLSMLALVAAGSAATAPTLRQAAKHPEPERRAQARLAPRWMSTSTGSGRVRCANRRGRRPGVGHRDRGVSISSPNRATFVCGRSRKSAQHIRATRGGGQGGDPLRARRRCVHRPEFVDTQSDADVHSDRRHRRLPGSIGQRHGRACPRSGDGHGAPWQREVAGNARRPRPRVRLTPPTVRGAVAKTVRAQRRAKRARVSYSVTAQDNVDRTVAVSCKPRSRSWFRLGRTRVTCSATDSSANTRTVSFTITVRPRR